MKEESSESDLVKSSAAELSLRQAKTCSGGLGSIHLAC